MTEHITEDDFFAKIESSYEWATKEYAGGWDLFIRNSLGGRVSKFRSPDFSMANTQEWLRFGIRIHEVALVGSRKWRPDKFDIRRT